MDGKGGLDLAIEELCKRLGYSDSILGEFNRSGGLFGGGKTSEWKRARDPCSEFIVAFY